MRGAEQFAYNEFGQGMLDALKLSLDEGAIDINKNKDANEKMIECFTQITSLTSQTISRLKHLW